ncbi:MAG TPA: hypothetical protein GXZ28_11005 [Clostridiales bacterium]|jgi:hypothetical protein|nr:hypothetical protein [Clostridiales bacterium]
MEIKRKGEVMQLLVLILKNIEMMEDIIKQLAEEGISGGTILDGSGMAGALLNMEDLPLFGMLRRILVDEEKVACKVMMFVLKDERVMTTRETIKKVVGDFSVPNTGIMFSIPITYVEGLGE